MHESTQAPDPAPADEAGAIIWTRVAALSAFAAGSIVPVRVAGRGLLLVRDGGRVYAVERACPHEGADLAQGRCAGGRLLCPHHRASFALADGAVSPGWSFRRLRTYPVRVVGDAVWVAVGQNAPR
ncbi:Rieske (2Fe-2S) protein [Methylobacterium soli]|uniref:Rieske (2Fe-2S) protein n=1 Tax=Methylobacterium soli TaxID=553447 RepID=UPI00208311A4|nr:3-phenylpropionate/cinnamic acid dioxygenase ferredoxin subunit [Methylobacterium soli]